jgi:hypothetical protein
MAGKPSAKKFVEAQHTNKRLKAGRSGSLKGGDAKTGPTKRDVATSLKFRDKPKPAHKTVKPQKDTPKVAPKELTEFGKQVEKDRKRGLISPRTENNERNKRRYNMPRST